MGLLAPVSPPTANRTLMPRPSPPPSPPAYFWPLGQICLLARRGVAHLGGWVGGIHVHGWAKPKDPVRRGVYPRAWDGLIETCSVRTNQMQPVSPFAATLQLRAERRTFAAPVSCATGSVAAHPSPLRSGRRAHRTRSRQRCSMAAAPAVPLPVSVPVNDGPAVNGSRFLRLPA